MLPKQDQPNLLAGHGGFEDAGVYKLDAERALVQTTDFFPPIVDDARWFGRIAAANALSDVYAMGGKALTALNIVCWPKDLDIELLGVVLAGGMDKVIEADAALCGGHSVTDTEIKFGLAVTGLVHPDKFWRNTGGQEGDVVVLTKPLGMGPVSTSIKQGSADARMVEGAMTQMATLNKGAAEVLARFTVRAATDITGFGLMGHAFEMIAGTDGLRMIFDGPAVPVFDGALELARKGVLSGGSKRGRANLEGKAVVDDSADAALAALVYDAETSGGLMAVVPESEGDAVSAALRDAGVLASAVVGRLERGDASGPRVVLR